MTVATKIKKGDIVVLEKELYKVLKLTHITPGKGNAVVQADLRGVRTGVKTNKRFRSSEEIETSEVESVKMQYLYNEGEIYHFMAEESFEQYEIKRGLLDEAIHYIIPENTYNISLHEGSPIGIELPAKITMKITETDPARKGMPGETKAATFDSGLVIRVPLFIETGEEIIVNPETGEYLERA